MLAEQVQSNPNHTAQATANTWLFKLFDKSVLKKRKLKEIKNALPKLEQKVCLDMGSDNGVISYYLRELGGEWHSVDLNQHTVESIRSLVRENVELIDGKVFPFEDNQFDLIVVVDMLEHVEDDRIFTSEIARVLKPGGYLLINAPNLKKESLLKVFRNLIGQTDEAHGHLRSGYALEQLIALLDKDFSIVSTKTYSRFFSELIDTLIVFAYGIVSGKKYAGEQSEGEPSKGLVITEAELRKYQKNFKLYSMIYPIVYLVSRLDYLIPFLSGYMRMTVAKRR